MSNAASTRNTEMYQNGWVTFAGIMMIMVGFFHAIFGLVAILKPSVLVATENHLVLLDYNQWGWLHLIAGIIVVLAAGALFAGRLWGRIVAIVLAIISAIFNFSSIWAYPIWSIMMIVIDVIVIYSVAMSGNRFIGRV